MEQPQPRRKRRVFVAVDNEWQESVSYFVFCPCCKWPVRVPSPMMWRDIGEPDGPSD